jgi:hypothetical protein
MCGSAGGGDEVEANALATFAGKTVLKLQSQKQQEQQEAELTGDQLDVAPPVIDDPLAAKIRWVGVEGREQGCCNSLTNAASSTVFSPTPDCQSMFY